jgi:hypothetical protein
MLDSTYFILLNHLLPDERTWKESRSEEQWNMKVSKYFIIHDVPELYISHGTCNVSEKSS